MNIRLIIRVIGLVLRYLALAMLPSLIIALIGNEDDLFAFIVSILLTLLVSMVMTQVPVVNTTLRVKEALTVVTLGWVFASAFGALPFIISGYIPNFIDAYFETVSGLTTTGASILTNIEVLPHGLLFWRSFTHWIGGMGILVLALAIMPSVGVGAFQLFKAESPGPISDKLVPKMKDTAKILYTVYLGITLLQVFLLWLGGMSLFESLIHTFGTVGTGGFSTRNASIGAYLSTPYIVVVITLFMIASGVNFSLYYDLYKRRFLTVFKNSELRIYLTIVLISSILIAFNIRSAYNSMTESFMHSFFQVSSIITTTGYATTNFDLWPSFSKTLLFFLMFVGGSAGSTAGSIKVVRLIMLFKLVRREVQKLLHPRAIVPIQFNGKLVQPDVIAGVSGFFFLYLILFAGGTLILSLEDISFISAASAVAVTLGNIGPGFELVGPVNNYSFFSPWAKVMLSFLMLFGRLELYTIIVLLTPTHWSKH